MSITKAQIIKIKTLCGKLSLDSADLAASYSSERTTHVSDLTGREAYELIKGLEKVGGLPESPDEKMKRKILSKAHEMGWELSERTASGRRKINMEKVDSWCIKYGYLHKPLDQYTASELPQLVTQFSNAYKSYLTAV